MTDIDVSPIVWVAGVFSIGVYALDLFETIPVESLAGTETPSWFFDAFVVCFMRRVTILSGRSLENDDSSRFACSNDGSIATPASARSLESMPVFSPSWVSQ